MPTNLANYQKHNYHPGRNTLVLGLWYLCNHLFFNHALFPFSRIKIFLLRSFGAQIGKGVFIKPSINIKYPWHLSVGNHVWIGEGVWIDNLVEVNIGDHVCLSQGAMLLTGNHNYKKSSFDLITGPIILKNGAWIGAKAIVGPGVIVGDHAVLSAGSVATENMDDYMIYQGNPARAKKRRVIQ